MDVSVFGKTVYVKVVQIQLQKSAVWCQHLSNIVH